jgi:hypothetical protein
MFCPGKGRFGKVDVGCEEAEAGLIFVDERDRLTTLRVTYGS